MLDTHTKNQINISKHFEKKVKKTVISAKNSKSKGCKFPKNQPTGTKLILDLSLIMLDSHTKNQINVSKHFEKKSGKTVISANNSKSKGRNFHKNQPTGTKLELDL